MFLLTWVYFVFLFACNQPDAVKVTQRDTTITPANAFTQLTLDSMSVELYIQKRELPESTANLIRSFYNSRNYQFAWFTEDGIAEQTRVFWNLHNNFLKYAKDSSVENTRLYQHMQKLLSQDSLPNRNEVNIVQTELQLTENFFEYAHHAYAGTVDPQELQWHIPRKKVDAVELLDSLISNKGQHVEEWEPVNRQYRLLKEQLMHFYAIEKNGGWPTIQLPRGKFYKFDDSAAAVRQTKLRLQAEGSYDSSDTSPIFNFSFEEALKTVQKRYGLKPDGVIGKNVAAALNVPVKERIQQLLINMERMRWMPKINDSNYILVNIPEFKLHVLENKKEVMSMPIVVGKTGTSTVVFSDSLKYIVFSPYWNVPSSIVRNEILPAMQRNPNYLAAHNMEQTGTRNGLPVIRQKPGGNNSLGNVKFIFPNNFNIYFHDTPAKSLFDQEKRAFSHGCIRLAQPEALAEYLLRNQPQWTTEKIYEAMYGGEEKWVTLKNAVPVYITYFTAWIDADGQLNFRNDIYGHDTKMSERLFVQ